MFHLCTPAPFSPARVAIIGAFARLHLLGFGQEAAPDVLKWTLHLPQGPGAEVPSMMGQVSATLMPGDEALLTTKKTIPLKAKD